MKLLFSVPTGYHARELIKPLRELLTSDTAITQVFCVTPPATQSAIIFPEFSQKFTFIENPKDSAGHDNLMKQYQPDIVITNTVGHDEKDYPILESAKKQNIPTLTFIASWDNVWKIERLLQNNVPVSLADTLIVWNTMMKEHLMRIFPELPEHVIHVIGAPRLDYFAHKERIPTKEALYALLGINDTTRPLLHFSTTELYPMHYLVRTVQSAIKDNKIASNAFLYASVHPGGNMDNHKDMADSGVTVRYAFGRKEDSPHPSFLYNPTTEDIYNLVALFKYSSVLINHSSTTAIESLLADVPVINVKYGQTMDWWKWYRSMVYRDFYQHYKDITDSKGTTVVKNATQLVKTIHMYLENPQTLKEERLQTVKKMITTIDGTASAKVIERIKLSA